MARIDTGNALTTPVQQPGGRFSGDGYGLTTATVVWKADQGAALGSVTNRGSTCPLAGASYCDSHNFAVVYDALGTATITVDYVGIDPTFSGGTKTVANTSIANGLTAEHITSHPNFFVTAAGYAGGPLAGMPSNFGGAYNDSTLGPVVNRYNVSTQQTVPVPSCEGYYGACFEYGQGGRFIGFVDPDYPTVYGKTQYLARTTTYSGVIYFANSNDVVSLYGYLGKATSSNSFGAFQLIPAWGPTGSNPVDGSNLNLLSQVNVEEYGLLYKVIYEIRYSNAGWDAGVYINV